LEKRRRILLVVGFALACLLWSYADLSPLVTIRPASEETPERIVRVHGDGWKALLDEAEAASRGEGPGAWRCGPDQEDYSIVRRIFFRPTEGPIPQIADHLPGHVGDMVVLEIGSGEAVRRFELRRWEIDGDDFGFGSGISATEPPRAFFRPFRAFVPWILLVTLAAYVLLPRPKRGDDEMVYGLGTIVASDFAGLLLFVPFFALPLLIVGGTVQAITGPWFFVVIFWAFSAFGLWILAHVAWAAGYALRLEEEGLAVRSDGRWTTFPFREMERFGPAVRRSPRWLRTLLIVGALFGRGGAAGAAAMGATQETPGLAIRLPGGRTLYVWTSSPLGALVIGGADGLPGALRAAGVKETEELSVYTGLGRGHLVGGS
jgi:hypothetical protein